MSIISIENLSKSYLVGHQSANRERYTALRDVVGRYARSFVRKSWDVVRGRQIVQGDVVEEFWALQDVCFDVEAGQVVGIVGRNGAGKSTLLKILSRITDPTAGRVTLRGRVASLLEVGTGFHPELTGRENIFLNGAILGMCRAEIKSKFDEIVAFAEVESFLDTPVKRYSSGMYVRLAFAVAAHLDPEILVVDEVLAVGDAAFQKKCLGKMKELSSGTGRTVLFVSHNLSTIQSLCNKAVLLEKGRVAAFGDTPAVVKQYSSDVTFDGSVSLRDWTDRKSDHTGRILSFSLLNPDGTPGSVLPFGSPLRFKLSFELSSPVRSPLLGIIISSLDGENLLDLRSCHDAEIGELQSGIYSVETSTPPIGLYAGEYMISPWIYDDSTKSDVDSVEKCAVFRILENTSHDLRLYKEWGKYFVESKWMVTKQSESCHRD